MDEYERFMSRARAQRRAELKGKRTASLWDFKNWPHGGSQGHHLGRKKFSDLVIDVPRSMHPELTRRQMEEHPREGPDPHNLLERHGRVHLALSDLHESVAGGHRLLGERMLDAARRGERDPKMVDIPKGLTDWLRRSSRRLARIAAERIVSCGQSSGSSTVTCRTRSTGCSLRSALT
jgi:hypothetical protein